MKSFTLCALAIWSSCSSPLLAAEPPKDQAQAAAYFEAIVAGDAVKADQLSTVPFFFDRKQILKTKEEVHAIHQKIADDKGKRPVPPYTIAKTDPRPMLDAAVFPKYTAFLVVVGKEGIVIFVSEGESPKVIGFSD